MSFIRAEDMKQVLAEADLIKFCMEGIKNSETCISKAYLKKKILSAKRSLEFLEQFCEEV